MTQILLKLFNFLNLEETKPSKNENENVIPLSERGFTEKEEFRKRSNLYSKAKNKKVFTEKEEIVNINNKLFRVKTQEIISPDGTEEIIKTEQYQINR
ncbi:hypothetical protein [Campylobacter aviculae]|uniref:Uncharacterized protein n=1 Tax=Campylobacter aviculae TaxID=2510190 RepID=A0A4U7BNS7_9BACT|nr:hypothetical protein [Campylobacter aviculae]TKX31880.1 hypothetical protein CQA76_05355 [Campylobacter aviculae]